MKQNIEIDVPEGKIAVWKDGKVYFIDIELPKTWEEFCKNYPIKKEEYYINNCGALESTIGDSCRLPYSDTNILPSFEAAKAHLALMQLHQLRDCYRQGWVPDLGNAKVKFGIKKKDKALTVNETFALSSFLLFQSREIAVQFLDNFRDLIEQAGDLI